MKHGVSNALHQHIYTKIKLWHVSFIVSAIKIIINIKMTASQRNSSAALLVEANDSTNHVTGWAENCKNYPLKSFYYYLFPFVHIQFTHFLHDSRFGHSQYRTFLFLELFALRNLWTTGSSAGWRAMTSLGHSDATLSPGRSFVR